MTSTRPADGGPFSPILKADRLEYESEGISLRDYFAVIIAASIGTHMPMMRVGATGMEPAVAREAYRLADAMLAARAEGRSEDSSNG